MYTTSPFNKFSKATSRAAGHPATFATAILVILAWAISGPLFHYSDSWQLVINTGTTIITFLMVFLIQNTQNRDSHAVQIKLDEIIRCLPGAHTVLLDLEELNDCDLDRIRERYQVLARKAREDLKKGQLDTNVPDVVAE